MGKADPFKLRQFERHNPTLYRAMADSQLRPFIGVTQGGSSRKYRGAKPAATKAEVRQNMESTGGQETDDQS